MNIVSTSFSWTPVEEKHPPINQVCWVLLEYYDAHKKLQLTTQHLAIGVSEHTVNMLTPTYDADFHKVAAWAPVLLTDKYQQKKVAEFLTKMAKGGE